LSASSEAFSERYVLWDASLRLTLDHPLGVGLGNYPNHILAYQPGELGAYTFGNQLLVTGGAENMYLTLSAELGILTVVAFILIIGKGVLSGIRARLNPEAVAIAMFWLAIAIMSITAYGLMRVELGLIFWLALAATENVGPFSEDRVTGASSAGRRSI
jgi:O-antigen ligase